MQLSKKLPIFLVPLLFLILSLATIKDYSVNWDAHTHYQRGQTYLNFFLPLTCERESFYQTQDLVEAFDSDNSGAGHPPLNGILMALSNKIFYQCLNWLPDLTAYYLPVILASFLTILVISIWSWQLYGKPAALISGLALATYPLFWAESHNNPKDPMETAFFTLTLFCFYQGLAKRKARWILLSAIAAGFALGTKFNIVFAVPMLGIWLFTYITAHKFRMPNLVCLRKQEFQQLLFALLLFVPIMFTILFLSWPFLWLHPLHNLLRVVQFYFSIGTQAANQPSYFYFGNWNTYPLLWVIFTTPLVTLFLAGIGILTAFKKMDQEKNKGTLLVFLWLIITLGRVSLPESAVYGGSRQFMEFLPALAMLAGLGGAILAQGSCLLNFQNSPSSLRSEPARSSKSRQGRDKLNLSLLAWLKQLKVPHPATPAPVKIGMILVVLSFVPISLKLISLHPNEVVYLNPLIGGLKGAYQRNFPGWGVSANNIYIEAIKWLNQNAETNAKVTLASYTLPLPAELFRADLDYSPTHWSGPKQQGEYVFEAFHHGRPTSWYRVAYFDKCLRPVYVFQIEGITLLKVWKNDPQHTQPECQKLKLYQNYQWEIDKSKATITFFFNDVISLAKILLSNATKTKNCTKDIEGGFIFFAQEKYNYQASPERLTAYQTPFEPSFKKDNFTWYFAAPKIRALKFKLPQNNNCLLNAQSAEVFVYD